MDLPLEIAFHGMDHSDAIERLVRDRAEDLFQLYPRMHFCRVVVEAPHHHHQQGNVYGLKIHLEVPGEDIHVTREPAKQGAHEDPYVTVRDTFQAARRRLQDFIARRRDQARSP